MNCVGDVVNDGCIPLVCSSCHKHYIDLGHTCASGTDWSSHSQWMCILRAQLDIVRQLLLPQRHPM